MLSRVLTQVTHIKIALFSTQEKRTLVSYRLLRSCSSSLLFSTLLSLSLCPSFQTRRGFLKYIFELAS
ncbi:unnamed protein product [Hymenolepis diminuta]|uniref:Uncharacterized protein n=1 Tax=Hymenolepis diminuta TaxID=6216 RepID=A0A564Z9J9_HYMDI|nr:unnamed protein product [Hymenolepis diminuta]